MGHEGLEGESPLRLDCVAQSGECLPAKESNLVQGRKECVHLVGSDWVELGSGDELLEGQRTRRGQGLEGRGVPGVPARVLVDLAGRRVKRLALGE
eukprot:3847607-Pleurochrysis_carterae.AAC.2